MTKQEYCTKVEKAKEYIRNGDIFQVVFAQQFKIQTSVNPFNAYRALRVINPSPICISLILEIIRWQALPRTSRPGTGWNCDHLSHCRKPTTGQDGARGFGKRKDLVADPKENAEHTMLVDLGRNDIEKSPNLVRSMSANTSTSNGFPI